MKPIIYNIQFFHQTWSNCWWSWCQQPKTVDHQCWGYQDLTNSNLDCLGFYGQLLTIHCWWTFEECAIKHLSMLIMVGIALSSNSHIPKFGGESVKGSKPQKLFLFERELIILYNIRKNQPTYWVGLEKGKYHPFLSWKLS